MGGYLSGPRNPGFRALGQTSVLTHIVAKSVKELKMASTVIPLNP